MRGKQNDQPAMFYAIDLDERIPANHPLRPIKAEVDRQLAALHPQFEAAYSKTGRPSVPPEQLLKALLLQCLFSVPTEARLVERIDLDLLFRWFLNMDPAEDVFDATAFTHNRERLENHGLVGAFFDGVVKRALDLDQMSEDHFSVDGTMIESYASLKSFQPIEASEEEGDSSDNNGFKPRNAEKDFKGQKRSNETHQSKTDPEARLYRKGQGQEAKLAHLGHLMTDNRNGLVAAVTMTEANGTAEPQAALTMVDHVDQRFGLKPSTLGSDKGYDSGDYFLALEERGITPHSAMRDEPVGGKKGTGYLHRKNRPKLAARQRMANRMRSLAFELSQRCRKKVEEPIGWLKTVAHLAKSRWVGRWKMQQQLQLAAAAYNLVRVRKCLAR
jgi:transposase